MGDFTDKTVVVVGAGPGIGTACAQAFAQRGASVVLAARNQLRIDALAGALRASTGVRVIAVRTDLADLESCRHLIDAATSEFGGVDVCVNVATGGGDGKIDTTDLDAWRQAFEINVLGVIEVSRSAARSMVERGGGSIVQIGTLGALTTPPGLAPYTSTKAAQSSASHTMAKELGRGNVRVNVIVPGYVEGSGLDAITAQRARRAGRTQQEVSAELASTAALRRHVTPDDIAAAAVFLCSDAARNITGIELPVTAGQGL